MVVSLFKKKNRPYWKTCRCCKHGLCSSGGPFCQVTGRDIMIPILGWKTWNECIYFNPEKRCMTCNKYINCPRVFNVCVGDKIESLERSTVCGDYEPLDEICIYVKTHTIKKLEEQQ